MIEISLNDDQRKDFQKNGFLIIESFLNTAHFDQLYESVHNLFTGNFETGIEPDPPEATWILARDGDTTSGLTVFNSPTTSPS